jgi:cellulose 1,4-beta-cellobiosidase
MSGNSITQTWCVMQKAVFNEKVYPFSEFGGMVSMGKGMGMVLVMGLWDDHYVKLLWLDATYSTDGDPESLGPARGECKVMSGVSAEMEAEVPGAQVVVSNIKFGPIGSTFKQPA